MKNIKKLILSIVGVISCLFSYAQVNINLSNKINMQVPKGAVWYNDSTYTNRLADNLESKRPKENRYKHTYKLADMTLKFREIASISPLYLETIQKGINSMNKQPAILKKINGNHFLIETSHQNNFGIYSFYCLNSNKTIGITGIITYKTSSKSKEYYLDIINDILKTIKFTE